MANWVWSNVSIFPKDNKDMHKLHKIYDAIKKECFQLNGKTTLPNYLCHLARIFGVSIQDIDNTPALRPRAWVEYASMLPDDRMELCIESAWSDCGEFLKALFSQPCMQDFDYVYISFLDDDGLYINTDIQHRFYKEQYWMNTDERTFGSDSRSFESDEEVIKFFNECLTEHFVNVEEIFKWLENYEGYCNLYRFEN